MDTCEMLRIVYLPIKELADYQSSRLEYLFLLLLQ